MNKRVKIGVISFAHGHAYGFTNALLKLDDVELIGISDDNMQRGHTAAKKYNTKYFNSHQDLLQQDIDAVIITSENIYHHRHVIESARAKKHILCEKPLATTVKDAKEMIQVCSENDVKLQIAFPVRFNTSVANAKYMIERGDIGDIIAVKATNRGRIPNGWFVNKTLSGGGAVLDHTVHLVDVMRWIMEAEVCEVYAESDQLFTDTSIDDAGIINLQFTNNAFATIDCSWSRHKNYIIGGDITLKVVGTKGILDVQAYEQNLDIHSISSRAVRKSWGDSMNLELIRDFVETIKHDRTPSITGLDGLKTVEVAMAAYQSSENCRPVKL